jgi:transcriptional regulator with XRE-family HTH domain
MALVVMVDRERVEALLSEGFSQAQVAQQLGVHPSTVSRALADFHDADGQGRTQDAVDMFVESLGSGLAPDVVARVAALYNIAGQLDWASGAGTGTAAMATAALNVQFCSLLDELKQSASLDELREALLAAGD